MPKIVRTIEDMENIAAHEDDDTCNVRLKDGSWLRVVWFSTGYRYYHDQDRRSKALTREKAKDLL